MSARLVNIDRKTPMLLPPDLRDWVKEDDLAHFLVDALEVLDLSQAVVNERGSGSEQYPPGMMLVMLIYCYARGIFSSRQIERATYQHLSVRYLAGNEHPDHDTIASFRRRNAPLLQSVFVQLLRLAKASGLLRLGAIALDGTKIKAAAAKKHTLSFAQIEKEIGQLDEQVQELLARAEAADQSAEQLEPGELPAELADVERRRERLLEAKAELERQARTRYEEREALRQSPKVAGRGRPKPISPAPRPRDTINLTDPQSTLTPTAHDGFIQGYNAQIALEIGDGKHLSLIVAAEVVRDTNDSQQLQPMSEATVENLQGRPENILADSGYINSRQILEVEQTQGITVLSPPAYNARAKPGQVSRYRWERQRRELIEALRQRLKDPQQKALYGRRNCSVEPAFGIIKSALGFDRFRLRGLEKVRTEWALVTLAFNCRRFAAAQIRWN